jgi:dGTPase
MPDHSTYFPETTPTFRTWTQRDRDRVLYSDEFQRLAGITQVASPEVGPVLHNRLTHSLKVAQVARRLAEALKIRNSGLSRPVKRVDDLDVDAVEAAALAHDIGHPPFGHVAEQKLNELAGAWGGFEGNAQSFRIVNKLAQHRIDRDGLNLTKVTLNGLLKYPWHQVPSDLVRGKKWGAYMSEREVFEWARKGLPSRRTLEAEIMDWADDVTYAVHDMQDFHVVGLVPLDQLTGDLVERNRFSKSFYDDRGELKGKFRRESLSKSDIEKAFEFLFVDLFRLLAPFDGSKLARASLHYTSSVLIGRYVDALQLRAKPARDQSLVLIERASRAEVAVLKELAWFYIINRPSLATVQYGQEQVIEGLHDIYVAAAKDASLHKLFPTAQREALRAAGHDMRCVTDLVAGLTEEMAFELYWRLTGKKKASILDAAALSAR